MYYVSLCACLEQKKTAVCDRESSVLSNYKRMRFSTAKDVQHLMRMRHERKKQSYHRVLDMCYGKIEKAAKLDLNWCIFDVPEFILGQPIYALNECIQYTIAHLQQKGFQVHYYFPKLLVVVWQKPTLIPQKPMLQATVGGYINTTHTGGMQNNNAMGVYPNSNGMGMGMGMGTGMPDPPRMQFFKSISEFKPSGKFVLNLT